MRAWAQGRRLSLDRTPRMDNRQRAVSTMRNQPPSSLEQVQQDAHRARDQFRPSPANLLSNAVPERPPLVQGSVLSKADDVCHWNDLS